MRVHVPVPHCRHGDDGPPARHGDAGEDGAVVGIVDEGGEEQHAHAEEQQKQEQLLDAGLQRVEEDPQAWEVPHQAQDAEDAQQPQEGDDVHGGHGAQRGVEEPDSELDKVGQQGQQFEDGHG